jgi:AAA15 family ATPase/GTPase
MIKSASLRNFKSLRNVDIDLERLTVIVGPNASGKTSILEGLYYLARLASVTLHEFLKNQREFESLRSRGVTDEEVRLECSSGSEALRLKVFPPQKTSTDVLQHDLSAM